MNDRKDPPMITALTPIGLAELLEVAELQTRVDRKYLVRPADLDVLLRSLGTQLAALEIDGARRFAYESVYFDTPDLASYLGAARSRPRRFKVRTRTYLDSGRCLLEVKTRIGPATQKTRFDYDLTDRRRLTPDARRRLSSDGRVPGRAGHLVPALTTLYDRATLLHLPSGTRLTCDTELRFEDPRTGDHASGPDLVVLEVKSEELSGPVDRRLWRAGYRPVPLSKYGAGMALLHPYLPANKWNRTLRRHFGWQPRAGASSSPGRSSSAAQHVPHAPHRVDAW